MAPPPLASREAVREQRFADVWNNDLNDAFADIARYYDRANEIAALGLWSTFLKRFMQTVDIKPQQKVLDVCAGTNAIGVALLKREPTLDVQAMDRSAEMQAVGQQNAKAMCCPSPTINSTSSRCSSLRATCAYARCSARSCVYSSPAATSTIRTCCVRAIRS